jgi:hypothetical protein
MKTAKQINDQLTGSVTLPAGASDRFKNIILNRVLNPQRKFELCIPHLPPSELMPNKLRTIHWGLRAKITTVALNEAYLIIKSTLPTGWTPLKSSALTYEFTVKDKRRRDLDNLVCACKVYLDALVSTGVIVDDSCWHTYIDGAWVLSGDEMSTRIIVVED